MPMIVAAYVPTTDERGEHDTSAAKYLRYTKHDRRQREHLRKSSA